MSDDDRAVLLSGIVGSTAYGLSHEDSDVDRMGVFTLPTEKFFLLDQPNPYWEQRSTEEDITLHEARKFLGLALNGNPTVSELLWLEEYERTTEWGRELVDMRHTFLSAHRVVDAYLGYARQQFHKLREASSHPDATVGRREKHARHLRRLVEQGYQLYTTGQLTLRLENPEEVREFGRRALTDPEHVKDFLDRAIERFEDAKTPLPNEPNPNRAQDWLLRLRKEFYR